MTKRFFLLLFLYSSRLVAQDATVFAPDSVRKTLLARPVNAVLRIDGRLDEAAWKTAPVLADFVMIEPVQGSRPTQQTEVRVLYNHHFLYISAFCRDSLGRRGLRVTDFRRDFSPRSHDHFGIAIDGFGDRRNAMMMMTNPYGTQRDLLSFDDALYDTDWDGLWRVRTSRLDSGWVAEFAIPWQTLRYPKSADSTQTWGINFFRNRRMTNEATAWSPFPRAFSPLRMDYAGQLANLQPPPPSPNIQVNPYLLWSNDRYDGSEIGNRSRDALKLGGEVKWAINPNSVLDLTFNTDFAQADADRQVNNVTRFSVFFPERRQFFLENASLFGTGLYPGDDQSGGSMRIQPFFSRRIGLDDFGNPIPIQAGARYVYRSLKRNYGGILMRQMEQADSPATVFAVGRYSQNIGAQNRIGGLFTLKQQQRLDSLPSRSEWVGAVDGFFRFGEKSTLNGMLIQSAASDGQGQGVAGYARYTFATNQWKIWWTQSVVTKNFNPSVGFVSRSDVVATTPGIFWYNRGRWIPFRKHIRAFEPGIMTEFYHQASTGRLIERQLAFNPIWFNFQRGGFFGVLVTPTYQYLTEAFVPLGVTIAPGCYNYTRYAFWAATDPSRKISSTLNYEIGSYYDGRLGSADWTVRYSPIPHISINMRYTTNRFKEVGEEKTSRTVDLYTVEGRFALNPRVQLIGFYQKNTDNNRDIYNIRLAWEYRPLSFLYLVFNHRGYQQAGSRQNEQHVIGKVSFLKQF
ncbi:carbohydrate binding family 9 domain-containing protein [Tellurirhabdus rosea]|uniref:carbohydrate binding family 9 domain-containing protein n=1 Tax=Tellurirhabdus rosea TaxID=2674997 RepID=UPI00225B279A|nr:DUF5916 domain-containing protein [Tellurirhabdus rosea]